MGQTSNIKQSQPKPETSVQVPSNDEASMSMGSPMIKSELIFQGHQQRVIDHGGEQYTLRITKQGKLILTK